MMKMMLGLLPAISLAVAGWFPSVGFRPVQQVSTKMSKTRLIVDSVLMAAVNYL
jgi:hypothetical protein